MLSWDMFSCAHQCDAEFSYLLRGVVCWDGMCRSTTADNLITLTSSLRVVDVTNLTIRSTVNATIDGGNAVQLFNITRSHVTFAGINLARGRQNEPTADGALLGGCMAVVDR